MQADKDAQELLPKFHATGIELVANRCLLQGKYIMPKVAVNARVIMPKMAVNA